MRFIKILLVLILLSFSLPWSTQPTAAKGVSHRIIISSDALTQDIIVDDMVLVNWLSMGRLENTWCEDAFDMYCGAITEPTTLSTGYTLERQFKTVDTYQTLDEVVYYPSQQDRHGYVYYTGLIGGSSEYDNGWFYASSEAETILKRLIDYPQLADYIMVAHEDGNIFFLDAETLENRGTVILTLSKGSGLTAASVNADGQKLIVNIDGSTPETREINLADQTYCSLGSRQWIGTSFDKQHHLYRIDNMIEVRDATSHELMNEMELNGNQLNFYPSYDNRLLYILDYSDEPALWAIDLDDFRLNKLADVDNVNANSRGMDDGWFGGFFITDGITLSFWEYFNQSWSEFGKLGLDFASEVIEQDIPISMAGARFGILYTYAQQANFTDENSDGHDGIYGIDPWAGTVNTVWHEDMSFAQIIYNQDALYSLTTPTASNTMLYKIDMSFGKIVADIELTQDAHFVDYVQLDAEFAEVKAVLHRCATPYFEIGESLASN